MDKMTFENFDKFQRKPFADRLTKVISTFYPYENDAFVLSLNAGFGGGKTTFLRMWEHALNQENPGYEVLYINAWETDFDDEPLVPIINALLNHIDSSESAKNIKTALKGALVATGLYANQVLTRTIGLDTVELLKDTEKVLKSKDIQENGKALHDAFDFKQKAYENLKTTLSEFVEQLPKKPLVILVDELDRARPDYSVKFLEAIKHIFSVQGICFVLAVDRNQLKESVKQLYGEVDFNNWYRRFVTREANLPKAANLELDRFIGQLWQEYFAEKKEKRVRFPFSGNQADELREHAEVICKAFRFTPRQMEELFRIYSQFLAVEVEKQSRDEIRMRVSLFLIAMHVSGAQEQYHALGQGSLNPELLLEYINTLQFSNHDMEIKREILFSTMAFILSSNNEAYNRKATRIMTTYENDNSHFPNAQRNEEEMLLSLSSAVDHSGHLPNKSNFEYLYDSLEDWRSFIE